jgi:DNA primase catalytic core
MAGEEETEERRVVGYRIVHVFDQSQTDGEPLPEMRAELVEGSLPVHWELVTKLIADAGFGFQVADSDRLGEANGLTDWTQRDVIVRASLPGAQRFKTAVHELAHVRLHKPTSQERPTCRGIIEVEAESVAYMVCAALGIDSAGYSLPYVASWSGGDLAKVTATANRVIGCARTVIDQLEQNRDLEHERENVSQLVEVSGRGAEEVPRSRGSVRGDLERVLEAATDFYTRQLRGPAGAHALEYLRSRSMSDESLDTWQLGYAPDAWQTVTNALRQEGFNDEMLLAAGVVGRSRNGRLYDRLRGRVVFPILDQDGRPSGFAGRLIKGDGPKYLNTPETELYHKGSLLYGLHLARQPIREAGEAIIVEGYTDAIAAHQSGFSNVVATAGTALTAGHLDTLTHLTTNVTLAFDGDHAGLLAARRAANLPASHHVRLSIAHLPENRDPADLLANNASAFTRALEETTLLEHCLIEDALHSHSLEEPESLVRAIRSAGEVVAAITDADDRDEAMRLICVLTGRDEGTIRRYLQHSSLPSRSHRPGMSLNFGLA